MDHIVDLENLHSFVSNVFTIFGASSADSRTAADVLIFADQRGIRSHGVGNLERIYIKRIRLGRIDPSASPQLVHEDHATALLDGNSGLGLVVATRAMDLAIQKAHQYGVAVVAVRNSSHFGAASYYSVRAMNAGLIGVATSNLGSQAIVRPPEGALNLVGTNPITIAAPAAELPSFVLDMSTSVVATGRIRMAQQRGEAVPAGWLVDENGNDVTDPNRFVDGQAHLQFPGGAGGYKGFGLALAVDVLSGILSGAAVGPDPKLLQPGNTSSATGDDNVGHLLLAIDIARFRRPVEFKNAMDQMLQAVLDCPPRANSSAPVYPGYPEAQSASQQFRSVLIDACDYDALVRLAEELRLEPPKIINGPQTLSQEATQCA